MAAQMNLPGMSKELTTSLEGKNKEVADSLHEMFCLFGKEPLPKDSILEIVARLNIDGYKVTITKGDKGPAALCVNKIKPGVPYTWIPKCNKEQEKVLRLIDQLKYPVLVNQNNYALARKISLMRAYLWQLYKQVGKDPTIKITGVE